MKLQLDLLLPARSATGKDIERDDDYSNPSGIAATYRAGRYARRGSSGGKAGTGRSYESRNGIVSDAGISTRSIASIG